MTLVWLGLIENCEERPLEQIQVLLSYMKRFFATFNMITSLKMLMGFSCLLMDMKNWSMFWGMYHFDQRICTF